ncbi:hypothetical protein M5689_005376 [Euphorbia peplus]|nr:hypothetical protein M5689_005376 [Euphorbia peplus]
MAGLDRLSTQDIMKVSRDTFKRLSSRQHIDISAIQKFFDSPYQTDLSDEEIKDVELALVLIASAHKASEKHFDEAKRLLNLCGFLSSCRGNPVQRVVHYFTKALQERIARETGRISPESTARTTPLHPNHSSFISCCLQLPFVQICHFAAIQEVIDSFSSATKLHFVDLAIQGGEHCPVLIQALANRQENPVEFLKITVVGMHERGRVLKR